MAVRYRANRPRPWQVYWTNPFDKKRETRSFETEAEAERHDSLVKHQLKFEPELFRPAEEAGPDDIVTVDNLFHAYLRSRKLPEANLDRELRHVLELYKALPPATHVTDLNVPDMKKVVGKLRDAGQSLNTIHRRVGILKAALNWAESEGRIAENPILRFKLKREEPVRVPPPTPQELEAILRIAPENIRRMIVLGVTFGMRVGPSEMFKLTWDHVDFERGIIRVESARKNKRTVWRDLFIDPAIRPVLRAWFAHDAARGIKPIIYKALARMGGKPVTTLIKKWREVLKQAGIARKIRPYDLRHAFATYALLHGADRLATALTMGHADTTMLDKHYQHIQARQMRDVSEKSSQVLGTFLGTFLGTSEKDASPPSDPSDDPFPIQ